MPLFEKILPVFEVRVNEAALLTDIVAFFWFDVYSNKKVEI